MATISQAVTTTPTVLAHITRAVNYSVQNLGPGDLYIYIGSGAPSVDQLTKMVVGRLQAVVVKASATPAEDIYVWSQGQLGSARVAYDTAP